MASSRRIINYEKEVRIESDLISFISDNVTWNFQPIALEEDLNNAKIEIEKLTKRLADLEDKWNLLLPFINKLEL